MQLMSHVAPESHTTASVHEASPPQAILQFASELQLTAPRHELSALQVNVQAPSDSQVTPC